MTTKTMTAGQAVASHFYVNLGQRIRQARLATKRSLTEFADDLGVSYQQLQKYEDGHNRVTIDRMLTIVTLTGQPIGFFVKDLDRKPGAKRGRQASTMMELINMWDKIPSKTRSHIMAMCRVAAR